MAVSEQILAVLSPHRPSRLKFLTDSALNDSNKSFTAPLTKLWKVHWVRAQLIATATVGGREIRIKLMDASPTPVVTWEAITISPQTASTTENYYGALGVAGQGTETPGGRHYMPFPSELWVPGGWAIQILDNAGIDFTADDLTIQMMVQEFDA